MTAPHKRRLPVGAEVVPSSGGAHVRVWAPKRRRVDVMVGDRAHALAREPDGYFSGVVLEARAGTRYKLRLDGGAAFPDPASRHQPEGPHAASAVVDPSAFAWTDTAWTGVDAKRLVLYELHFGPDGNYLREFSDDYFSARHRTDWGDAINFDDKNSGPVRELVLANVRHWIDEYHFDGLRLDATDNIYDDSRPHLLREIGGVARDAARGRSIVIACENEAQDARLTRSVDEDGFGLDPAWNDDFQHP